MPSLNTGNAILSNAIAVNSSYNVGIGGAASGSFKLEVTGTSNLTGALSGTSATFIGNVGIGTSSPSNKLTISNNGNAAVAFRINDTNANASFISMNVSNTDSAIIAGGTAAIPFDIYTGGILRTRLGTDGQLLLGTSVATSSISNKDLLTIGNSGSASTAMLFSNGSSTIWGFIYNSAAKIVLGSSSDLTFETGASYTERMRITSGGNVYVGPNTTTNGTLNTVSTSSTFGLSVTDLANSGNLITFKNVSVAQVGFISQNGTNTTYSTSSDYRLKEDFKEVKGLESISAIKVYDFKFKNSENRMDGVIAHELQEIIPYAVVGEKDAVNEDGSINPQGVDYSMIVPTLVKAIQELNQKINDQQQTINSLINR
jgi:hypothetical protein